MSRDHLSKRVLRGAIITTLTGVALTALVAPATAQSTWRLQAKMEYPDRVSFADHVKDVSLSGERALIGEHLDDEQGRDAGAAYVYEWIGRSWVEVAKLVAADGSIGDYFGCSVSLSGDRAVVGAYADDDRGGESGSAYIFERIDGTWREVAKLTASDGDSEQFFGVSVSLSGGRAVVGAAGSTGGREIDRGAAYIFEDQGPRRGWRQVAKLTASDGEYRDDFGASVCLSGERVLVGAPRIIPGWDSGAAYLFELTGGAWTETQKLLAADGPLSARFGASVSLSGTRALIGARADGSAYVFEQQRQRRFPFQPVWAQVAKLTGALSFGQSVSLRGDRALIGSPNEGAAYVFERLNGSWLEQARLTSPSPGVDGFGRGTSLGADRALIGCLDPDLGAAYTFSTP